MFRVDISELRTGDFIHLKHEPPTQAHRVRAARYNGSSELVEIDFGDIVHRDEIESVTRQYRAGDWGCANA